MSFPLVTLDSLKPLRARDLPLYQSIYDLRYRPCASAPQPPPLPEMFLRTPAGMDVRSHTLRGRVEEKEIACLNRYSLHKYTT